MLEPEDASSLFPLPENQLYLVQDMLFLLDLLGEVEPEEPILEQEVTLPLDQLFFVVPAPFLIAAVIEVFLLALVHMQVVLLLDHAASLRQFIQNAAGVGVLLKTAPRIDLEVELVFALVQVDRPYLGGVYQRLVKAFVFVVLHEAVLYLQLYVLGLDVQVLQTLVQVSQEGIELEVEVSLLHSLSAYIIAPYNFSGDIQYAVLSYSVLYPFPNHYISHVSFHLFLTLALIYFTLEGYMNERRRRLKSIETDLSDIYQDLFGVKYIAGLQNSEKTEFHRIIEAFRERIYSIRAFQQEREKKEAKRGFKPNLDEIRLNQDIRDDIKQCEHMLEEAVKRIKIQGKGQSEVALRKLRQTREATISNCEELLKDVKMCEQRGTYKAPEVTKTIDDIRRQKKFGNEDSEEMIDVQDVKKFMGYKKKDDQIDENLQEVIKINREVKDMIKDANEKIDESGNKIRQNLLRGEKVEQKIEKATSRLQEVLKEYRRPNKLCLNITMLLLFLALIGVIVNLIKTST